MIHKFDNRYAKNIFRKIYIIQFFSIIMGEKSGVSIAGSRLARQDGLDPLKYAVDHIVEHRKELELLENQQLEGDEPKDSLKAISKITEAYVQRKEKSPEDPFSIGNISKSYIKEGGQLSKKAG